MHGPKVCEVTSSSYALSLAGVLVPVHSGAGPGRSWCWHGCQRAGRGRWPGTACICNYMLIYETIFI